MQVFGGTYYYYYILLVSTYSVVVIDSYLIGILVASMMLLHVINVCVCVCDVDIAHTGSVIIALALEQ